jgi:lipopolysaccharide/colanic/teichoic acid biosynthesis glycosyltransferase
VYSKFTKPLFDFLFALILLILFLPLFLVIALAIKLDSSGPVFYIQDRMGKGMKKFKIYKFRTMQNRARELQKKLKEPAEKYITRVGRVLRKTRLDEFPQLINILKGEMSFVGPRANIYENEVGEIKVNPERKKRYLVRPGITGLERLISVWPEKRKAILSRLPDSSELQNLDLKTIDGKLAFDLYYVDHVKLLVDSRLLFYTILLFLRKIKE